MKHQQLISGLNIPAYWLSTFVFDYLTYLCVVVMALILLKLFNMNAFIEGKKFPATVILFLLYGFAVAPFTYFMSFFFHSHTIGLIVVYILSFFVHSFSGSVLEYSLLHYGNCFLCHAYYS